MGAAITWWGVLLLAWAPANDTFNEESVVLCCVLSVFYLISAIIEDKL